MNKPSEVLWGAIRTIQKCGWRQRSFGNDEFGYCILGAIKAQPCEWALKEDVIKAINTSLNDKYIANWNDDFTRKIDQVLFMMRQIADQLSSQGK